MLAKFSKCLLIIALIGATGLHWTVLQSVAWMSMLADNVCTNPLPAALEKTFDGNHPCALCKEIAKGRQGEKKTDAQLDLKKFEFVQQTVRLFIHAPENFRLTGEYLSTPQSLTFAPPVPPPRNRAV